MNKTSGKQKSFQLSNEYKFFIQNDFSKFSGKWIAIKDRRIISNEKRIDVLMKKIDKMGIHSVYYTKIPEKKQLLLL